MLCQIHQGVNSAVDMGRLYYAIHPPASLIHILAFRMNKLEVIKATIRLHLKSRRGGRYGRC